MLILALIMGVILVADIMVFIALGVGHPVPWVLLALLVLVPVLHNRMESGRFVTWKPEYSVGIDLIDDDHKKLLSLINNLQAAVHYHTGYAFEKKALDELVDYTRFHFEREEALMKEHDYPDYELHCAEHREMIGKVEEFVAGYQTKGHDVFESMAAYLKDWLITHINGTDQEVGAYIRGRTGG